MNNYLNIFCFLFLFLLNACSDENPIVSNSNLYNGDWLWLKSVGGLFPRVVTPKEGMTLQIKIDKQNNYRIYRNDSLKVSANYKIEEVENDWDKLSYSNIITYDYNFNTETDFVKIISDTLKVWDGMIDGYFSFYKRLQ